MIDTSSRIAAVYARTTDTPLDTTMGLRGFYWVADSTEPRLLGYGYSDSVAGHLVGVSPLSRIADRGRRDSLWRELGKFEERESAMPKRYVGFRSCDSAGGSPMAILLLSHPTHGMIRGEVLRFLSDRPSTLGGMGHFNAGVALLFAVSRDGEITSLDAMPIFHD